jgi:hypothetical protein
MFKAFVAIILATQVLISVGCDKGRVIDEDERNKVLTKGGNEKSDFGQNLQVYVDQMTPQSEYRFVLYNSQAGVFVPVKIQSLLRLEENKKPVLSFLDRNIEMTCLEQSSARDCDTWTYSFNIKDFSSSAPSVNFEITLSPKTEYSLSSFDGDAKVHLADYQSFHLKFTWPDAAIVYYITKQNFFVNAELVRATVGFDINKNFSNLFYGAYFWPNPSYLVTIDHLELIKNQDRVIEFFGVFKNVKTEEFSKVHYLIEAL